jgi:hypothetical protein
MRLKHKYRLHLDIDWKDNELTIGDFCLTGISTHYQ